WSSSWRTSRRTRMGDSHDPPPDVSGPVGGPLGAGAGADPSPGHADPLGRAGARHPGGGGGDGDPPETMVSGADGPARPATSGRVPPLLLAELQLQCGRPLRPARAWWGLDQRTLALTSSQSDT